jgi:hypothetical protein
LSLIIPQIQALSAMGYLKDAERVILAQMYLLAFVMPFFIVVL